MENKIIMDSCMDFNPEIFDDSVQFERIPFKLRIDDDELVDTNLSTTMLLDRMKMSKHKISTACPSPQEYLNAIEPGKNNYIITISSKLSGSHNAAMGAVSMAKELNPDTVVHVFDSKSAVSGEDLIFMKLKSFFMEKLPVETIVTKMNDYIKNMNTVFILNSLDNLAKNGRISNTVALMGKVLHISPIMCAKEGEIELKEKVRGRKRAFARLVDIIAEEAAGAQEKILAITHVHALENALKLKTAIEEKCNFKKVIVFEAGGLSTVYADNGGIVIAF